MKALARLVFVSLSVLLIPVSTAIAQPDEPPFSQAELDQMLAPIALYPDTLLSQILVASTYPLEVVEATRWTRTNPDFEADQAVEAVADQPWDPSVKALVAVPQVLEYMHEDLDWTTRLGDAFLYQETQVMEAVQRLRQRAHDAGNLNSTGDVQVIRENNVTIIEPVHPWIVFVPYYDPRVIYGGWWWPSYPPIYWAPPLGFSLSTGFFWGRGVHVSLGFFSTFDWYRRHVLVVHHHHIPRIPRFNFRKYAKHHGHKWRHRPIHRRGVAYRHHSLRRAFGRSKSSGLTHRQTAYRFPGSRFRREYITRSHQRPHALSRRDDRRATGLSHSRRETGSYGQGGRRATMPHSDSRRLNRNRGAARSPMAARTHAAARHSGTRRFSSDGVAGRLRNTQRHAGNNARRRDAGNVAHRSFGRGEVRSEPPNANRGPGRRRQTAQGNRAPPHSFTRDQLRSRRSNAARTATQRPSAYRRPGSRRSPAAGRQRRDSAGSRRAGLQPSNRPSLSRGTGASRRPSAAVPRGSRRNLGSGRRLRASRIPGGGRSQSSSRRGSSGRRSGGQAKRRDSFRR